MDKEHSNQEMLLLHHSLEITVTMGSVFWDGVRMADERDQNCCFKAHAHVGAHQGWFYDE